MRKNLILFLLLSLIFSGCRSAECENRKFERLFCWAAPVNEEQASRYAAAGVTDILVGTQKQFEYARKYGMNPYWKIFTPAGPHVQKISAKEQEYLDYISGKDLDKKIPKAERNKIIFQRRKEKNYFHGGDAIDENTALGGVKIACFSCDEDLVLTKKKLTAILKSAPVGSAGIFMDYFGYNNHRGCYCENCLLKYEKFLKSKNLADTPSNRTAFYRQEIIDYYNKVTAFIKSQRSDLKSVAHVYPYFRDDPWYANGANLDYCAQTVAWYFKWKSEDIVKNTRHILEHAKDYHPNTEAVPFLGLSSTTNHSLYAKTPEEVASELEDILSAGAKSLMVCYGQVILEKGYFEVFRKYCK